MLRFLARLLGSVGRGLWWMTGQAVRLPFDIVNALGTAVSRQLFPPAPEQEESTAEVLREVATMIQGQSGAADARAVSERPAPRPASEAIIRRSMEGALAYTGAMLRGDTLPSLAHVQPAVCHELRRIHSRASAEVLHRELMGALGLDADGWVRPGREREVVAPGHEETPTLRYA